MIDHGFNDSEWSQQKYTLQSAGKQIRKLFISKQSGKKNFEIDIEPIKESDFDGVDVISSQL